MSKKYKKGKQPPKETTIENFYDLKTKEMDELVAALKGETPEDAPVPTANIAEITGETQEGNKKKSGKAEFDPYKRDKFSRIFPFWLKALFIKFWFFGLVCYFVLMGLGIYITNNLDLFVVCGLVTGVIVDCLVNPIFRMMESDRKEYNYFMMFPFPFKKIWTFFANLIYYLGVMILLSWFYELIFGVLKVSDFGGVEPLGFGLACLIVDMALIGIKDLIVFLVKRAVKKSREKKAALADGAQP
ncbi:MAG: hypothetical protein ACLSU0_00480 [Oscillospiraceae bacterium]